ncbi:MAG: NUDIX domain-containing protein [Polyangiaceae bacterium]|nr:NUDIX domain-containing protein [Polyangiaceae bacterium]
MVEVVSAVIVRRGRILLTQRRPEQDYPLRWESPGGKVEAGETHFEAMRRELREEINVEGIAMGSVSLWSGEVERPGKESVFVHVYAVETWHSPKPAEGQGIGWFGVSEFVALDLMPANLAARDATLRLLLRSTESRAVAV